MQSNCGIYSIRCLVSSKRYVGSSKSIRMRWSSHRRELRAGTHRSPRLLRAWSKHGEQNFIFEVLEYCQVERLFEREQHWIDALKPDYNSMLKVRVVSKEMRAKIRATVAAKMLLHTQCRNGHEYSEANTYVSPRGERRCKQCNADRSNRLFASLTPEQRKARSAEIYEGRRARFGFAKHSSPEHIAKIVAKNKGREANWHAIARSAEVRAAKTHCKNGHEYAVVGVRTYNGMRACKACSVEAKRRYRANLKAA